MPTQNSELAMTRVVHPIVRTHPESNRKGLFINEAYTTEIEGVSPDESFALLSFLFRHAVSERFHMPGVVGTGHAGHVGQPQRPASGGARLCGVPSPHATCHGARRSTGVSTIYLSGHAGSRAT